MYRVEGWLPVLVRYFTVLENTSAIGGYSRQRYDYKVDYYTPSKYCKTDNDGWISLAVTVTATAFLMTSFLIVTLMKKPKCKIFVLGDGLERVANVADF